MAIATRFIETLSPNKLSVWDPGYSGTLESFRATIATENPAGTPYLVAFEFDAGNNSRGQMSLNGTRFFDSYSAGSGDNRVTAGWGVVETRAGGTQTSEIVLNGSGSMRISKNFTVYYVRLDGGV